MTDEKKKGSKKKWLTVIAVAVIGGAQALATAGVVPPVIGNLLGVLSAALGGPAVA